MKKLAFLLTLCLAATCCLPALAAEVPQYDAAVMETHPEAFSAIMQSVGWQMPAGYALETYMRGDLSNDGHDDSVVASLLAGDSASRMLVVIIANPFSHHVYTSLHALPATNAGALGTDPFMGFSVGAGFLGIHVADEDTVSGSRVSYTFGFHGNRFYLDAITVDRWTAETMAGTEEIYWLDEGTYTEYSGRMDNGIFMSESALMAHAFDPNKAIFALEEFDINTFPLAWDAFYALIESRATPAPHPTHVPTSRPRPTYGPLPTGMPGPVYPTDMPGPIYPTDMPGPVYPTDMPGPVYITPSPSPSPEPTDMPGPIDWDSGDADE